jgi:periplasmic divalent cation tolerance protein
MSDTSPVLVYMTAADVQEAEKIGETLVRQKLAACINILNPMQSLFWWQDAVQSEQETVLLAKTQSSLVEQLSDTVRKIHSYDCPCIVALPIVGGNPEFLDWIASETSCLQADS